MFKRFFNWLFGKKEEKPVIKPPIVVPPVSTTTVPADTEPVIVTSTTPAIPIPEQPTSTSTPIPIATPATSVPIATPATATPVQETMIMGDYEYIKNAQGQWEIKVDPAKQAELRAKWKASLPPPPVDPRLEGRTALGGNRYGLNLAEQERVANRALGEAKYAKNNTVLNTILSRIVEPGIFDPQKFPLLKRMVDVYLANGNNYPLGAIDLSNVEYVPAPGTPDVRIG